MIELARIEPKFTGPVFDPATESKARSTIKRAVQRSLNEIRNEVVPLIQDRALGSQGFLANSIVGRTIETWPVITGLVGSPLTYAPVFEFGRRPGQPGPPIGPILYWTQRTRAALGIDEDEVESVAYAIREKIHRDGTDGRFPFTSGFAAAEPKVNTTLARAAAKVAELWDAGREDPEGDS